MEKDNYNIDDILSEVKKRREENKEQIISGKQPEHTEEAPAQTPVSEVEPAEEKAEQFEFTAPEVETPSEKAEEEHEFHFEKPQPELPAEEPLPELTMNAEPDENLEHTGDLPKMVEDDTDAMVDLVQMSAKNNKDTKFYSDEEDAVEAKKLKKKKITKAVIIVLVVLIVGAAIFGIVYANNALNSITGDSKKNNTAIEEQWNGMDKLVETFEPINETEASDIASLQDMIKTWYYNGKPAKSTHVLNVLLIGEDTRGDEILEKGTRADSAIIASINVDTGKITLTSILRDTYAYWEDKPGDKSTGEFGKINGAMSVGNVDAYINCVEKMYKIDIDNYAIVNFDSFESIVDTLGGVTLELTDKEINEINSHQKRYGNVTINKTFEGTKGEMKLNGKQALAYCRIRKLDSDNMRANRQKICLTKIFEEAKGTSTANLIKIVNSLIPYVKTGFNKSSVIKIAKYALSEGWMNYEVVTNTVPDSRINEKGAGGIFYGAWCWKADFPQDAYNLQTLIYGKSNITLAHTRVDVLKCALKGFRSEGAPATTATITNTAYGEATTLKETTTEKKETTSKKQ